MNRPDPAGDLVGFALGALDEAESERVRAEAAGDPARTAELARIERHLALHDHVARIAAPQQGWTMLRQRLEAERARRGPLARFWPMAAAAALLLAAFLWPHGRAGVAVERIHGDVVRLAGGDGYACTAVSRVRIGDGVVVTMDAGTTIVPLDSRRLALRAGRAFFEVSPQRRGFTVEAGALRVETTGTRFAVDAESGVVGVDSGSVRCSLAEASVELDAGWHWGPGDSAPRHGGADRSWFTRPSMSATIPDETTLLVVIRNEMPDPIELAPPTGGEPLFYVQVDDHEFPLAADAMRDTVVVAPGAEQTFRLALPRPIPRGTAVVLSYPDHGLRLEVRR